MSVYLLSSYIIVSIMIYSMSTLKKITITQVYTSTPPPRLYSLSYIIHRTSKSPDILSRSLQLQQYYLYRRFRRHDLLSLYIYLWLIHFTYYCDITTLERSFFLSWYKSPVEIQNNRHRKVGRTRSPWASTNFVVPAYFVTILSPNIEKKTDDILDFSNYGV